MHCSVHIKIENVCMSICTVQKEVQHMAWCFCKKLQLTARFYFNIDIDSIKLTLKVLKH